MKKLEELSEKLSKLKAQNEEIKKTLTGLVPPTEMAPAAPLLTHPALMVGVTFCDALTLAVIKPPLDTLIDGLAVIVVAGVVALPAGTDTLTCSIASYPVEGLTVVVPLPLIVTVLLASKLGVGTLVVITTSSIAS